MEFGHVEILATDPANSRLFYEGVLGFETVAVQHERFIWMKKGELEILIRPGQPAQPAARYEDAPTGIVFYTSELAETLAGLVARGLELKGTVDSDKCYTFTDPDGNWFQLVDPGDH